MTVRAMAADSGRLPARRRHDLIEDKEHPPWICHASSPFARVATASTTRSPPRSSPPWARRSASRPGHACSTSPAARARCSAPGPVTRASPAPVWTSARVVHRAGPRPRRRTRRRRPGRLRARRRRRPRLRRAGRPRRVHRRHLDRRRRPGTVDLLDRSLRPGGLMLIGEPYWRREAPDQETAEACHAAARGRLPAPARAGRALRRPRVRRGGDGPGRPGQLGPLPGGPVAHPAPLARRQPRTTNWPPRCGPSSTPIPCGTRGISASSWAGGSSR